MHVMCTWVAMCLAIADNPCPWEHQTPAQLCGLLSQRCSATHMHMYMRAQVHLPSGGEQSPYQASWHLS